MEDEEQTISNVIPHIPGIYLGSRGSDFTLFIQNILKQSKIKQEYIDILTTDENMIKYGHAFTSNSVDEKDNYQFYEQLGDVMGNHFIVKYMYKKFPFLQSSEGVKVVARLKINYGSKQSFSSFAEKLGFWDYISTTNTLRKWNRKDLLEDTFESFIGVTEYILDARKIGLGYAVCYQILKVCFDGITISLAYEDLYDAKTRLKELFDMYKETIGNVKYVEEKKEDDAKTVITSTIYQILRDPKNPRNISQIPIGKGEGEEKMIAQQEAAKKGIEYMNKKGYIKSNPRIYSQIQQGLRPEMKQLKPSEIPKNINELFPTREKVKYQRPYESTLISYHARRRMVDEIKQDLEKGADPNIVDIDGLNALDRLLIGEYNPELIKSVMKKFVKAGHTLKINKEIYKKIYKKYLKDPVVGEKFKEFTIEKVE